MTSVSISSKKFSATWEAITVYGELAAAEAVVG